MSAQHAARPSLTAGAAPRYPLLHGHEPSPPPPPPRLTLLAVAPAMAGWTRLTAGLPTSLATRLRRRRLEAFKFSVYLLVPVGASYYFGSGAYPYLERIIQQVRPRWGRPVVVAVPSVVVFFVLGWALRTYGCARSPGMQRGTGWVHGSPCVKRHPFCGAGADSTAHSSKTATRSPHCLVVQCSPPPPCSSCPALPPPAPPLSSPVCSFSPHARPLSPALFTRRYARSPAPSPCWSAVTALVCGVPP